MLAFKVLFGRGMHLFTYGTLMFPEVWRRVAGKHRDARRATLNGYVIYRVKGEVFPVIMRGNADDRVHGRIYDNVADVIARVDEFESELYIREEVEVILDSGELLACQTYVLPDNKREFSSSKPWDADWFQREALPDYLQCMTVWGY